jgi:hypothetical protein
MILTTLAVASVSVWLVFPYFVLMAAILFVPSGRRERKAVSSEESEAGFNHGKALAEVWAGTEVEDLAAERALAAEFETESPEVAAFVSDTRGMKTKRGRGRTRRAKVAEASPGVTATWIRIGPGKFARAEIPGPPVAAESLLSEGEHGEESGGRGAERAVAASACDHAVAEVVDAALDTPRDALSDNVGEAVDFPAALSEIGAEMAATISPDADVGTEAVPTAEEPIVPGGDSVFGAGHREAPSEPTVEWTRDAGDQAREALGETLVAVEVSTAAQEADAVSKHGPSTDAVGFAASLGDNGIAPDAFDEVSPTLTLTGTVAGEASLQDRVGNVDGLTALSQRPDQPTLGRPLAVWRGFRPRVGSTPRSRPVSRSSPDVASPRCFVRPGRTHRVLPGRCLRSQPGAVPSRQTLRSFQPRSPPGLAEDFRATQERGGGQLGSLRLTPSGHLRSSPCSFVLQESATSVSNLRRRANG